MNRSPVAVRVSMLNVFLLGALALLSGCGSGSQVAAVTGAEKLHLQGVAKGGQQPLSGAVMQLYAAGTSGDQAASDPRIGATVTTSSSGAFDITGDYTCPSPDAQMYLTATGGNPGLGGSVNNAGIVMVEALGRCGDLSGATKLTINEVTTVASLYPLAPFANGYTNIGAAPADQSTLTSAFAMVNELVNPMYGQSPGPTPSGSYTVPVAKINTLSDAIAACVNTPGGVAGDNTACGNLYTAATPPGGTSPTNVADAVLNIASFPYSQVTALFNLQNGAVPFQPALSTAPADWAILPLPAITLAGAASPVGVGASATGTITLAEAAPAGGAVVTLTSSDTSIATVTSPVTIAAGQTSGTFTYTGAGVGTATISAVAPHYAQGVVSVSPTNSMLNLGNPGTIAPGQTTSVNVSLSSASATDTVVTLALSAVSPSGAVTLSSTSVTITAGSTTPATQPTVTGVAIGTATLTATASNYVTATRALTVSVTASVPATASIPTGTTNETLTISSAAPTGGVVFTLASSNTAVATVPATVTVAAGTTSVAIPVVGVATGTSTITITSPNVNTTTINVSVGAGINTNTLTTANHLINYTNVSLSANPPAAVTVTVTSNNPSIALLSKDQYTVGTPSLTFTNVTNTSQIYFWASGESIGSTTYTVKASGFADTTGAIAVWPSGFYNTSGSFSTTTLSGTSSALLYAYALDPSSLVPQFTLDIAPDVAPLTVTLSSSDPTIGTTAAASIPLGSFNGSWSFTPAGGTGTTQVAVVPPAGFSVLSNQPSVTATVSMPGFYSGDMATGAHVMTGQTTALRVNPPSPRDVTVSIADPTVAVLSTDNSVMGTGTIVYAEVTNTNNLSFYLQGLKQGTTTITYSAPGFATSTYNVFVGPSSITQEFGPINTTTFSGPQQFGLECWWLSNTNDIQGDAFVNPDQLPLTVNVSSSDPTIGTFAGHTNGQFVFTAGVSTIQGTFTPANAGTSTVSIVQPAGFTVANQRVTSTATVSAPPIYASDSGTGVKLQGRNSFGLSVAPPSPVTVTLTVADPTIATIASDSGIVGTGTLAFANSTGAYFWVQGQKKGTTTMTFSAPGYATQTQTIYVQNSGVYFGGYSTLNTTTYSGPTQVQVALAVVNDSGSPQYFAIPNPDVSPIVVGLASSNPAVGTIDSSVSFTLASGSFVSANFTPGSAGTTTLSLTPPAGLTPMTYAQTVAATVTAPPINVGDLGTGLSSQSQGYYDLSQTPPAGVTVTLTIANPSIGLLSKDPTAVGTQTITFTNVTDQSRLYFYLQGQSLGSTTITTTAPGFQTAVANAYVEPSVLILNTGNFTTSAGADPTNVQFGLWAMRSDGNIDFPILTGPNAGSLLVSGSSSNPGVGNITMSKLPVNTQYFNVPFVPGSAGSTTVTIVPPSGFGTPVNPSYSSFTATVQ